MNSLPKLALAVAVVTMTATACQRSDDSSTGVVDTAASSVSVTVAEGDTVTEQAAETETETETGSDSIATEGSPTQLALSESDLSLPPARGIDELAEAATTAEPVTTSISIERIGLAGTAVRSVGVESNGDMTVPPPLDVGWYRYGPTPGEAGSAVLAGHIASGGVPGAFRHLDRLESGDLVTLGFDDGTNQTFVVDELLQVDKTELPFDSVFARSGPSKLALITCGGEFDYNARSYTDNVVVIASPVSG